MKGLRFLLLTCAALPTGGAALAQAPAHMAMTDETIPSTTVEQGPLALKADFQFDAARRALRIRYLLHNRGKEAVALFDRGDTLSVAQGRLKAGMVGPLGSERSGDDLTVGHRAAPLRKPAPTVPPVPLAARVEPGGQLGGDVLADVGEAKRVRYCLGVAPFDAALFSSRQPVDGVDVWRASFEVVETQKLLCTPWFDVERRDFTH